MLRVAGEEDIKKYMDFVYALSQDLTTSSFPTYLDEIKTRADFEEISSDSMKEENTEILLFEKDGAVLGWIQYYWIPEDLYIGFDTFNMQKNISDAIDEFLAYAKEKYKGYEVNFGFPAANCRAVDHLEFLGFQKIEESDVFVLHFENYQPLEAEGNIVEVSHSNWQDFRRLHDQIKDIYWDSEKLHAAAEKLFCGEEMKNIWRMFLYYDEKGEAIGNIYFVYRDTMMEIFGIDYKDDEFSAPIMKQLLRKALNQSKADGQEHMTFFTSGQESNVAREEGLQFITEYKLYRTTL